MHRAYVTAECERSDPLETHDQKSDAKIPDLWRMSALLETRSKEVKEQTLLDELGE